MNAKLKQKRVELSKISEAAKFVVQTGAFDSVNEVLIDNYQKNTGANEFNTFRQWKEKGYSVKKGEKSFPVWGAPLKTKIDKSTGDEDQKRYSFFPICNLFHDNQVAKSEH